MWGGKQEDLGDARGEENKGEDIGGEKYAQNVTNLQRSWGEWSNEW